eukprot:6393874-Pyramimonas_sp.AAC.1
MMHNDGPNNRGRHQTDLISHQILERPGCFAELFSVASHLEHAEARVRPYLPPRFKFAKQLDMLMTGQNGGMIASEVMPMQGAKPAASWLLSEKDKSGAKDRDGKRKQRRQAEIEDEKENE